MKVISQPKPKVNASKNKIKEIKKDFREVRYGFSKSKVNEFRRSLYDIKNLKSLSAPELEETEKNLFELKPF